MADNAPETKETPEAKEVPEKKEEEAKVDDKKEEEKPEKKEEDQKEVEKKVEDKKEEEKKEEDKKEDEKVEEDKKEDKKEEEEDKKENKKEEEDKKEDKKEEEEDKKENKKEEKKKKEVKKNDEKKDERKKVMTPSRSSGRQRKPVQHYEDTSAVKEADTFVVPEGKGTKLRDMESVAENLSKFTASMDETAALYRVLFGRRGKKSVMKKHIMDFSGLVYPEGEEKEGREKVFAHLGKWQVGLLKDMMSVMNVDKQGKSTKEELMEVFIDWLEKPTDSKKKKRKSTDKTETPKKKKKTSKSSSSSKKKKSSGKKKKSSSKNKDNEEDAMEVEDDKDKDPTEEIPLGDLKKIKDTLKEILDEKGEDKLKMRLSEMKDAVIEKLGSEYTKYKSLIKDICMEMV